MPQIQVLPANPSFGSQLGQALGGGLSQGIGAALSQMFEQKKQQSKINELMNALGLGAPSAKQSTQSAEIPQASAPAEGGIGNLTPEKVLAASLINPQLGTTLSNLYKTQQKKGEETQSELRGQEALDRMSDLVKEGRLGIGAKIRSKVPGEKGAKTAEQVGEFESLSGALEALLVDKVSRGTLSNARFKYITETLLPKPNDREATIKGKLKALSKELGLKSPEGISESVGLKKVEKGTKLSTNEAKKILDKANGDPSKARKLAQQLGYEF